MTTPECPKGPERGARPEDVLSELLRGMARRASGFRRDSSRRLEALAVWERNDELLEADVRRLNDEVSRLREQLAAQRQTAATSATAHKVGIRETGGGYRVDCETCGAWVLFADMNADRAEDWKEEHEAPQPVVHTVLLSSDTGVMGEWQAFCSGCEQGSKGDLAHAEFWKDQHLADVLVPTLTNESFISSQVEDEPERVPTLEELRSQRRRYTRVEGRPSGPTAAPRSDEDEVRALLIHPAAWNGLVKWLDSRSIYVQPAGALGGIPCWSMGVRDLSLANASIRDQCDWWSDDRRCPDWAERGGDLCRLHRAERERYDAETEQICAAKERDAAQAAGSEATPRGPSRCIVCGKSAEKHATPQWCMSEQYVDGSWPSPSLRKEGEDT